MLGKALTHSEAQMYLVSYCQSSITLPGSLAEVFYIESYASRVNWSTEMPSYHWTGITRMNEHHWISHTKAGCAGGSWNLFISLALPAFQIHQFFKKVFFSLMEEFLFWNYLTLVRFCTWPWLLKGQFSEHVAIFHTAWNHILPTSLWTFLSVWTEWY